MFSTEHWEARIARAGADAAYEELANELKGKDPSIMHRVSHVFGEALYEHEGLEGISTCDDRFIYGCLHQLVGEAIAHRGLPVLPELGMLCQERTQCLHGIGHGIVAYLGYTQPQLIESLDACAKLPGHDLFIGCWSGAFMEYALRSMLNEGAGGHRTVGENIYEPCDSLAPPEAAVCYFWQAEVWKNEWLATHGAKAAFLRMGDACRGLTEVNRAYCSAGVGSAATPAGNYQPATIAELCTAATGGELDQQTLCYIWASKALDGTVSTEAAEELCELLPEQEARICITHIFSPETPAEVRA